MQKSLSRHASYNYWVHAECKWAHVHALLLWEIQFNCSIWWQNMTRQRNDKVTCDSHDSIYTVACHGSRVPSENHPPLAFFIMINFTVWLTHECLIICLRPKHVKSLQFLKTSYQNAFKGWTWKVTICMLYWTRAGIKRICLSIKSQR